MNERGTGSISTLFGFAVFLGFLTLAVQVSIGLYARSTASAIGFDLTRRAAAGGAACAEVASTIPDRLTDRLGGWWRSVRVEASCDGERAVVRLHAQSARSVAVWLRRPLGLDSLDRTWTVLIETPR